MFGNFMPNINKKSPLWPKGEADNKNVMSDDELSLSYFDFYKIKYMIIFYNFGQF